MRGPKLRFKADDGLEYPTREETCFDAIMRC